MPHGGARAEGSVSVGRATLLRRLEGVGNLWRSVGRSKRLKDAIKNANGKSANNVRIKANFSSTLAKNLSFLMLLPQLAPRSTQWSLATAIEGFEFSCHDIF